MKSNTVAAKQYNCQGMRIVATFDQTIAGDDWIAPKALAVSRWLAPTLDDANAGQTVRAKWTACNWAEGRLEADVYAEFVPDVLAKLYRVARTVDFYRVTV